MRLKLYTILKATIPFTPPLLDYYAYMNGCCGCSHFFLHLIFLTSALFVTAEKKNMVLVLWYFAYNNIWYLFNLTAVILSTVKKRREKKRMNCVNEIREEIIIKKIPWSRYNWIGCILMWRFDENKTEKCYF